MLLVRVPAWVRLRARARKWARFSALTRVLAPVPGTYRVHACVHVRVPVRARVRVRCERRACAGCGEGGSDGEGEGEEEFGIEGEDEGGWVCVGMRLER